MTYQDWRFRFYSAGWNIDQSVFYCNEDEILGVRFTMSKEPHNRWSIVKFISCDDVDAFSGNKMMSVRFMCNLALDELYSQAKKLEDLK